MLKSRGLLSWAIVATIVAFTGTSALAAQAANSSNTVIYAAVQKVNGMMRIIKSPDEAKPSEEVIGWNQIGLQGPQGPQGPQGVPGLAGPQGPKGDTGAAGAAGAQGPQGPQGVPGLVGPQGLKGDTGAAGAAGAQGLQGEQGPAGPQGPKGDTGAAGAAGAQGPKGEQGPAGPQGPKGDTGAAGAAGAQGPKGEQGPAGPQGPPGPTANTTALQQVITSLEARIAALEAQLSLPSLSINDVTVNEGNSGSTGFAFTVSLSKSFWNAVTVDWATSDGSAKAGEDYQSSSGTLSFVPGETVKTIAVQVQGDAVWEGNETFSVNLASASGATILDGTGAGAITNDDPQPSLSINNVTMSEGDSGSHPFNFAVSLSNPSSNTVTVDWATSDGTAIAGDDYQAGSGTLSFAPGQTSKSIAVQVSGDLVFEDTETFSVLLASASGATILNGTGTGTMYNDDAKPSLSINDVTLNEGAGGSIQFTFLVTFPVRSSKTVTVDWATSDGTAIAGQDYQAASGTLSFAPGQTVKAITITVIADTVWEGNETFFVQLTNPVNAYLLDPKGTGTIINDDPVPSISIGPWSASEGDSGLKSFPFTVSLSNPSSTTVTVQWRTNDGTATAGEDYQAASGTLSFAPGQTSKTITINVIGDTIVEGNETFHVDLSNATNATFYQTSGTGYIGNDD